MKKYILLVLFAVLSIAHISAQRMTDPLDRGLVAVKTNSGVFVSWRVQADEYFDVTYNLYRDGTLVNAEPLSVSNYSDANGTASSTYTVRAVVNGVEQSACDAVSVWSTTDGNSNTYLSIQMQDVVDRNGDIVFCCCGNHTVSSDVAQTYTLNDASVADLDGDGEVEIIIKRLNASDASTSDDYSFDNNGTKEIYSTLNTRAFVIIEAYKLDGTRLWWIDCGPNMVSLNSTELNVVAYDWDQDGKAEVLMRGADNMIVHPSTGTPYTIGSSNVNTRNYISSHTNSQYGWTRVGNEYLLYFNGATGELYNMVDFPLKRLESSEFSTTIDWANPNSTDVSNYLSALKTAWGDNYGHRSSKYFFGAPFLDGRKPSIFLARGIYTRHKMIALDVNSDHTFTTKWEWSNNTSGSAWYGQGNHNFSIADVDGDGCDEIIYGSMTIDNNGKGLSTTGLGHGDALHVGDLDPYRKGLEVFACNEDKPNMNYRNATTSEIYYRSEGSSDDGRALMDNFTNDYPGSVGRSVNTAWISSATDTEISELDTDGFIDWSDLNWRIYWDGDLCSEYLESSGTEGYAIVYKPGSGSRLLSADITKLNNDSKNNASFVGDILGDWREEIVARKSDNTALCIYTTTRSTDYRIPSLWYDPEYRQAMVWQMCAYNQPPHVSYFLGEMEGFTQAPPTFTNTGRTELATGSVVTSANNNAQVMVYGTGNVGIEDGASPSVLFINVPSTVSGTDNNDNISYSYGSCQLGATINNTSYKGDLTGSMRLVKQGDGLLKLTNRVFTYTGNTDIWAGSVFFRGTLNSPVWMNCHTTLYTAGTYNKAVTMEYGSTLNINYDKSDGTTEYSTATISSLIMKEGSRVMFDIDEANSRSDVLNLTELTISSRDWEYGPEYSTPVFEFNSTSELTIGTYLIGTLSTINGNLNDIVIEGNNFASGTKQRFILKNENLYLKVYDESEDYIGLADNTSKWWTYFSDSYTINGGYVYNFKFTNYGNTGEVWYNWVLAAVNGSGHSISDRSSYSEYFVLRADNYAWGYAENTLTLTHDWTDEATFKSDMTNAEVDMDITYINKVLTISAVMTSSSGNVYNYTATYTGCSEDALTVFFTVDNSHMTIPVRTVTPYSSVKMTYVNYDDADTSYGEVSTAIAGYNKISGGKVVMVNTDWGADYITYIQLDLSAYKEVDVNTVTLKFMGSGSTDSKRTTSWGIGYNSSEWSSTMTYNKADKSITTIGSTQGGGSQKSTVFNSFSWDITDVYNSDEDGVLTILVYETNASGGYVKDPKVIVDYTGDDVMRTVSGTLTLEPKSVDSYKTGTYDKVIVNRDFNVGYSSLCVPFNATVEEFTGGDAEAYVAYLKEATENTDGSTTLIFEKSTDIEANQPYIIYLSKSLSAPTVTNKPVYAELPQSITVGDWTMTGNYEVGKSMSGLYGFANNSYIRKGGSSSTINGLAAFITGPANVSVKLRFGDSDATGIEEIGSDAEATITNIYTVNGIRVSSLQKGLNIVKMSDNSVRKILIK